MVYMTSGLPVFSISQCEQNSHKGGCLQLHEAMECFEPTFIEAHEVSNMIRKVRSLKSLIKTGSFLEDITTSSKKVFSDFKSDITLGM